MRDYYRIIEVHKDDGYYPNWQNIVGSVVSAETKKKHLIHPGFVGGHVTFIKPCPQEPGYMGWRPGESLYFYAIRLRKIHPGERSKFDELRQHAA